MTNSALGKTYQDGEIIVRQGEVGDCMYVIQEGQAEILVEKEDNEIQLRIADKGEILGEMAIFEHDVRSATVRALGEARVLALNKKIFFAESRKIPQRLSILSRLCSDAYVN